MYIIAVVQYIGRIVSQEAEALEPSEREKQTMSHTYTYMYENYTREMKYDRVSAVLAEKPFKNALELLFLSPISSCFAL